MEVTALIIDDELFAREAINAFLKKHRQVNIIGECASGLEALNAIRLNKPDLVFLDIQMPELTGFEVVAELDVPQLPCIIFTTAYDNFALEAFNANAIDYLLKPFDQERFDESLHKALCFIQGRTSDQTGKMIDKLLSAYRNLTATSAQGYLNRILIKDPKRFFFIRVDEILWFEASGDYVTVHKDDKTHLISNSLNKLETQLDPTKFIRIHRSTIVNLDYIKEMQPHFNGEFFITLKNGAELKLSRTYREAARHIFGF